MEPKLREIAPFKVAGISVRTSNSAESDASTAKLGDLWSRFYGEGMMETIPDQAPGSPIYGVYSEYESDVDGPYTTTAGMKIVKGGSAGDGLSEVEIGGGEYLVFERKGEMPAIVFETWMDVWRFFGETGEYARSYTTDFEEYRAEDEVAIHIAVRRN